MGEPAVRPIVGGSFAREVDYLRKNFFAPAREPQCSRFGQRIFFAIPRPVRWLAMGGPVLLLVLRHAVGSPRVKTQSA
jgi:hypothetical protein